MKSLSDDPESLCLVRELESHFNTVFTTEILTDADSTDPTDIKKAIKKIDKDQRLEKCALKAPLIAQVVTAGGSWPKLWDSARHLGTKHLISLTRLMAHHGQGSKPCPLCDAPTHPLIKQPNITVTSVFRASLILHCQQTSC